VGVLTFAIVPSRPGESEVTVDKAGEALADAIKVKEGGEAAKTAQDVVTRWRQLCRGMGHSYLFLIPEEAMRQRLLLAARKSR
jgi:hypothetical protein